MSKIAQFVMLVILVFGGVMYVNSKQKPSALPYHLVEVPTPSGLKSEATVSEGEVFDVVLAGDTTSGVLRAGGKIGYHFQTVQGNDLEGIPHDDGSMTIVDWHGTVLVSVSQAIFIKPDGSQADVSYQLTAVNGASLRTPYGRR